MSRSQQIGSSAEYPPVSRKAARDRLIAKVAELLLGATDEALDARITDTLARCATFMQVDRAYLVQNAEGAAQGVYTHEWTGNGIEPAHPKGTEVDFDGFQYLRRQFLETGRVMISALEELPASADLERDVLDRMQVKSLLVVALGPREAAVGAFGVQSVTIVHPWSPEDVELLDLVGNLVHAALLRRRSNEALRQAEARQRAILGGLPDYVFVLSADARIRDVHVPHDLTLPVPPEQLVGAELSRLLPAAVSSSVVAHIQQSLQTNQPRSVQYMLPTAEARRYFEVRFVPRNGEDVLALVRDISERMQAEQQLREQERLYEILVQSTQEAIVLSDRHGNILSWNSGAQRMFGYRSSDIIGEPLTALVPNYLSGGTDEVSSFLASGKSGMLNRIVELWGCKRGGERFPIEMTLNAYTSKGDTLLASVIRDITERRVAELALRESEQRYRQLVQNSADGILLHDQTGRLVDVNHRAVEMLGYQRTELLEKTMHQIEHDTLPEVAEQFWQSMHIDQAVTLEGTYQRKDGSQFPVETRLAKFLGGTEGPRILVIARDITERKANERVMLDHREQLRQLASQLTLTEEAQRRELAVQLHDGIGQELAMCQLRIQTFRSEPEGNQNPAHLETALKFVGQAIDRVHSLTFDLSPPALHELGLPAALRSLGRRIKEDHGLDFEYEESGEPADLAKELQVLLFRSVRELAINVVKHARAKTLRVAMRTSRAQVEIVVADDGVGIAADGGQFPPARGTGGFGLFSVKERLSSVQGELSLHRAEGTIATIVVPLDEQTPYAYMLGGKR